MAKGFFENENGGKRMTALLAFMAVVSGMTLMAAGVVAAFCNIDHAGTMITVGGGILVSGEALKKLGS